MHLALVACTAMGLAAGMAARVLSLALLSAAVATFAVVSLVLLKYDFVAGITMVLALLAVLQAWYLVGTGLRLVAIKHLPGRWKSALINDGPDTLPPAGANAARQE